MTYLPQGCKIVQGWVGIGTAAPVNTDVISLKHAQMCWIVVNLATPDSSACAITPMRDLTVAGAAGAVLVNNCHIWYNLDTALTDTFIRQADDVDFTTGATNDPKQVVIQVDPASLGGAYDCLYVTLGALSVNEAASVEFYIQPRYPQATPPSMILD